MTYVPTLKKMYKEQVVPALVKEFGYSSVMQVPVLEKIVINQGLGQAIGDKKILETAIEELTKITGQRAVTTRSKKDISNFKLRKGMPIGVVMDERICTGYEYAAFYSDFKGYLRDLSQLETPFDGSRPQKEEEKIPAGVS